jgi:hypothetical protein
MHYLLLISHGDAFVPTQELLEDIHRWDAEMDGRGVRLDGHPLRPPTDAVTVRVRDGAREVTAGPATQTPVAAYELIECDSVEAAVEAAAAHPMAAAGTIEVRPVWSNLAAPGAAPSAGP